jgi:hypothetical protein
MDRLTNRVVWLLPYLYLCLLIIAAFFAYPTAEDLAIFYNSGKLGTAQYIHDFYATRSGRYGSFPLLFVLASKRFLLEHYFIVPLVLTLALVVVTFRLLMTVNRLMMSSTFTNRSVWWAATLCTSCFVSTCFQPSSFLFWISGAMTYSFGLILFLLLLDALIRLNYEAQFGVVNVVLTGLLVTATAGTNETMLLATGALLISLIVLRFVLHKRRPPLNEVYLMMMYVAGAFFFLSSGTADRAHQFKPGADVLHALLYGFLNSLRIVWKVMSDPLNWSFFIVALMAGTHAQHIVPNLTKWQRRMLLSGVFLFLWFFCTTITFVSGEQLPPRANNLLAILLFVGILVAIVSYAAEIGSAVKTIVPDKRLVRAILFVLLLFNPFLAMLCQNAATGFVFRAVMSERRLAAENIQAQSAKVVIMQRYNDAAEAIIASRGLHQQSLTKTFSVLPPVSVYNDPLADSTFSVNYYASFLHLDTIYYRGNAYPGAQHIIKKIIP